MAIKNQYLFLIYNNFDRKDTFIYNKRMHPSYRWLRNIYNLCSHRTGGLFCTLLPAAKIFVKMPWSAIRQSLGYANSTKSYHQGDVAKLWVLLTNALKLIIQTGVEPWADMWVAIVVWAMYQSRISFGMVAILTDGF